MMAFQVTPAGYVAHLHDDERRIVADLARDIIYILGSDVQEELQCQHNKPELAWDWESAEIELAALAEYVEMKEEARGTGECWTHTYFPEVRDAALDALLPDMSEDPYLANELRALTEESIVAQKIKNLLFLYTKIREKSAGEMLILPKADAPAWAAALNDIRLVLASRLEIDSEERMAFISACSAYFTGHCAARTEDLPEIETPEDMMAVLYMMLSWWQDSLLRALRSDSEHVK